MKNRLIAVILAATLVALGALAAACRSRAIRNDEKELLLTAGDLGIDGVPADPSASETFQVKTNLGGSTEIEYEYDSEKDPGSERVLWLKSEAEVSKSAKEASTAFSDRLAAYKTGAFLAGASEVKVVPASDLVTLGDENYGAYLEKNGKRLGNIIVVRQGNTVFSLLLSGVYVDDPALVRELLAPKLESAGDGAS